MLQINYQNNWYDIEFNGLKIIETSFTTNFVKSILVNSDQEAKIILDNKKIRWKNAIYINEMSKITDLLSLNKSNYLYKQILELIADHSLVNDQLIKTIIETLNQKIKLDNLISQQYDLNKIILACFELNDLGYLDDDTYFDLLNQIDFDEKKLLIFDNLHYINYQKCQKLLNNFNVLIVTTDARKLINHYQELELCCFFHKNFFDVVDVDKLLAYLELKMATQVKEQEINNYLAKKTDFKSSQIDFYLKNL